MKTTNRVGIWMDHANAHVMEFTTQITTKHIAATLSHKEKEATLEKSENLMHHKENHATAAYYHALSHEILAFNEVLLFGPTEAKTELANLLKADHRFDKIKVTVQPSDRMTENQEHAWVRNFFSHH